MSWWGKLFGGAFGFMLGGPLGALIGAALGHNFDAGLRRLDAGVPLSDQERAQTAFFTATFALMGRLAKADGRVTPDEIRVAERIMDQMRLRPEQRGAAQRLFTEGKRDDFPLDEVLDQLRQECRRRHSLLRLFLEIQLQAAYADGVVKAEERELLRYMGQRLGFDPREFAIIEGMVQAEARFRDVPPQSRARGMSVTDAYAVLGVTAGASNAEVKKAYRRLMSQHHPDKLVAKGLPEEMNRLATEKTQEVKAAYERVKEARGIT